MKKGLCIAIALIIAFSLILFTAPASGQAFFIATPPPPLAGGNWSVGGAAGDETPVDLTQAPAPEWYQLMNQKAVVTTGPALICHPFRGGQFGWVGAIYQLTGDTWTALPTTLAWVPDKEGVFTACAYAPYAGTYALFGSFDQSLAPKKTRLPIF